MAIRLESSNTPRRKATENPIFAIGQLCCLFIFTVFETKTSGEVKGIIYTNVFLEDDQSSILPNVHEKVFPV
jgi:hypothetical protein